VEFARLVDLCAQRLALNGLADHHDHAEPPREDLQLERHPGLEFGYLGGHALRNLA